MKTTVLLIAGGQGTRFWPMSRPERPKQLLPLFGDQSMLRATVRRLAPLADPEDVLVITNRSIEDKVRDDLSWLPPENIVGEPRGCNTAPCVALGALLSQARFGEDRILAVLPADHFIADRVGFLNTARAAIALASQGHIATIGINPTRPETGYGYLECGEEIAASPGAYNLKCFVEKPSLERALSYLEQGNYLWNSGTFFFHTRTILHEFQQYMPDILRCFGDLSQDLEPGQINRKLNEAYARMPSISLDYGIMEKSQKIVAVKGDFGWSDVGSWRALLDLRDDDASNFTRGEVISEECANNVLVADEGITLATLGVDNLAVVATPDAVLVLPLDRAQDIRGLVQKMRDKSPGKPG